jgi:hypothetical protein
VIIRVQYLDLVYSQTSTLYDLILDAPHPSTNTNPTPLVGSHDVHGLIDTFQFENQFKQASHSNPNSTTANIKNNPPPTPSPDKTFEVNSVKSTPLGKSQNKKKWKGINKEEKNNNQQSDKPNNQPLDEKENYKPRYY